MIVDFGLTTDPTSGSTLLIPVHIWAVVVVTQLSSAYLIAVWWVGEARNPFKDAGRAVGLTPERG